MEAPAMNTRYAQILHKKKWPVPAPISQMAPGYQLELPTASVPKYLRISEDYFLRDGRRGSGYFRFCVNARK